MSQTLLRDTDRSKRWKLFEVKAWPEDLDGPSLAAYIRREEGLPKHLVGLLDRSGQDAEDVEHVLLDAYREWLERADPGHESRRRTSTNQPGSNVHAGLRRSLDWRTDEPDYAFLARESRGMRQRTLVVWLGDEECQLRTDWPGF